MCVCVCMCVCEIASFGVYICEKESDFIDDGVCYKLQGVSVSTAYLYRYNLKYSQLKLSFRPINVGVTLDTHRQYLMNFLARF